MARLGVQGLGEMVGGASRQVSLFLEGHAGEEIIEGHEFAKGFPSGRTFGGPLGRSCRAPLIGFVGEFQVTGPTQMIGDGGRYAEPGRPVQYSQRFAGVGRQVGSFSPGCGWAMASAQTSNSS